MSIINAVSADSNKRYLSANGSLLLPLALKWRLVRIVACSLFVALVLPCLGGKSVSAASITLTVPDKLLFSVPADGEFHESAAATISVESDSYAGYTFSILGGETTNAALKNDAYSIASIGSAMESSDFPDNTWGWLPSKLDSNANTKYQPGPTTSPVTIEKTNPGKADMVTNQYAFTLGAKVTTTVVPGAYSNTFTLTVTANDVPYNITYAGEGVSIDALTGEAAEGSTVTLAASPTREGYEFQGWCDRSTTNASCPSGGTVYEAEGDYTLANSANAVTLYAMWKLDPVCVLNGERVTEITDPRDGNVYKVRRLADGQCWMIQNLRLGDSKLKDRTLTPENTDLNGIESYTLPESADKFSTSNGDETQYINTKYVDTTLDSNNGEKIGVYYNWYAATAGTGTYSMTNTDATSSICPKGWRLPKGGDSGDFQKLMTAMGIDKGSTGSAAMQDPDGPNFVLSSYYYGSFVTILGSTGYYWSSTAGSSSNFAYYLGLTPSSVGPTASYVKYYGNSVRCIARTMQTVANWGDTVAEGQSVTAIDERDGNTYTVRRLADGKLWMIQNLRLGDSSLINRTIDSANSDLPSDKTFNVPTSSTSGFSDYRALNVYVDNTYGGYYTWGAATAGTGTGITYAEQQASGSICPKGWRLPGRNEFRELNDLLGTPASGDQDAYWTDPNGPNFVRAGFYRDGLPVRQGTGGYYWTSVSYVDTVPPSTSAYLFYNSSSTIYTIYGGPRKCGVSVRCIAQ